MLQYEMGNCEGLKSYPVLQIKQVQFLPFVLSSIGDFDCDRHYYTRRNETDSCLLMYTLEGQGIVEYDKKQHILSPGQLILLDCRKDHYYATRGERWHFLYIHFEGKCAFDYVELINEEEGHPLAIGKGFGFPAIHEKLVYYASVTEQQSALETSVLLHRLLTDLIRLKKQQKFYQKYGAYRDGVEASIGYLQKHFREKIDVEQLAGQCHLSKYYYIKVFKAYLGQTPYDYLLNFRLQKSQSLLLETDKAIHEIAQESGFEECKNYIACFKKKVGTTPLQYRKTHRI